jgi:hypothetical protein
MPGIRIDDRPVEELFSFNVPAMENDEFLTTAGTLKNDIVEKHSGGGHILHLPT